MAATYPKLRDDLVIKQQVMGGEVTFLIKIRETLAYVRFGQIEWAIISRLDGHTSYEDLARAFNREYPDKAVDAGQVEDFCQSIKKKGILVRSAAEQSIVILEKLQDERKKRAERSQAQDIFYLTLATTNPEKFYKAVFPFLRWIWTPPFVVTTLALFVAAGAVIVSHWAVVRDGMLKFWSFEGKTFADVALAFGILAVIIAIHESAHALTCMNFGGEVNELGFMLIYFIPAFYANVSDAYLFDKKWHKYWVTLAGGYSELIICSFAVFTWLVAQPDTFVHHVAYNVMVFAGISTIIFNFNPLIKLDGYYLLTDYLEVSNLRENSSAYIIYLLRKKLWRVSAEPPWGLTPRKKRIYLIYGVLSTLYIIAIVTIFLLFVNRYFNNNFGEIGFFLGLFVSYMILKKRLKKLMRFSQFVWLDKKELLRQRASVRNGALATAGLLLALLLYPFSHTVSGPALLEPERRVALQAEVAGFVADVSPSADQDRLLEAGEVILRLRNEELTARLRASQAENERLHAQAQRALAAHDLAAYQAAARELDRARQELNDLRRQESRLEIRAPFAGQVLTPRLHDLAGQHVAPGRTLLEFGATERLRARIRVSEFEFRELAEDQRVRLKMPALPATTFEGRVARRSLASPDSYDAAGRETGLVRTAVAGSSSGEGAAFSHFEVWVEVDNLAGRLRPGMTGLAKITPDRHSAVVRFYRAARDLVRSRVWW